MRGSLSGQTMSDSDITMDDSAWHCFSTSITMVRKALKGSAVLIDDERSLISLLTTFQDYWTSMRKDLSRLECL